MARTMPASGIACVVLCAALAACSGKNDVVANEAPAAVSSQKPYLEAPLVGGCLPGTYHGVFSTVANPDGGSQLSLSGDINFALVETQKEFLTLDPNSKLSGQDMNGGTFHATVVSDHACTEGEFTVTFMNGGYDVGTVHLPFEGGADGEYKGAGIFTGTWHADVGLLLNTQLTGNWSAVWRAK